MKTSNSRRGKKRTLIKKIERKRCARVCLCIVRASACFQGHARRNLIARKERKKEKKRECASWKNGGIAS